MATKQASVVTGENRHARKRRVVHEFASYCIAHLMLTDDVDLIKLRTLVNEMLQDWVRDEFNCRRPSCRYCNEFNDGRWDQSFKTALGIEKEGMHRT